MLSRIEFSHETLFSPYSLLLIEIPLERKNKLSRMRLVWAFLICVSFPIAISLPFIDAYIFKHVSFEIVVPFEFSKALLSVSSILFGFTSLIIINKEWVDKRIWAVLVPPLILIVLSGVSIGNLALGAANQVTTLLLCSATFNANVVSTGFILGYVTQMLPKKGISPTI